MPTIVGKDKVSITIPYYRGNPFAYTFVVEGVTPATSAVGKICRLGDPDEEPLISFAAGNGLVVSGQNIILSKTEEQMILPPGQYEISLEGVIGGAARKLLDNSFFVVSDTIGGALSNSSSIIATALSGNSVYVVWNAVTGATQYVLERSLDGAAWAPVYTGANTTFTDIGLTPLTLYYYRVSASGPGVVDSGFTQTNVTTLTAATPGATLPPGGTNGQYLRKVGSLDGVAEWANFPVVGSVTSVGITTTTPGVAVTNSPITTSGTMVVDIATASGVQNGLLSATDWLLFFSRVPGARTVSTTGSLTGGGDLTANRTFSLVNDNATPGNNRYYGTDGSGVKGFFPLPGAGGGGSVTSVGLSSPTSGVTIGASPVTTSGTITIAIATATALQQGLLSATDWNTFNNKVSTTRIFATQHSLQGGGDLSSDRMINLVGDIANPGASQYYGTNGAGTRGWYAMPAGSVSSVGLTSPTSGVSISNTPITTSGNITITISSASGSQQGLLSPADWTTFNNKVGTARAVNTQHSIQGGGNLSADRTLSLVGDTASPGNTRYYGTDGSGARGFFSFPFLPVITSPQEGDNITYDSVAGQWVNRAPEIETEQVVLVYGDF